MGRLLDRYATDHVPFGKPPIVLIVTVTCGFHSPSRLRPPQSAVGGPPDTRLSWLHSAQDDPEYGSGQQCALRSPQRVQTSRWAMVNSGVVMGTGDRH